MAKNKCRTSKKRGGADHDCGSSSSEEKMPSIELPNSRNMPVMTEFITAEGNGLVTLHKAMAAVVRVTERCATGFRFAVPTYMERLVIINIRDRKPRQLMLEAFFMPENARTKQIMPPPAALALMRPGFLERMKRLVETTLPPGFFPEWLVLPPTLLRRPEESLSASVLSAGSKGEHSVSCEDESPAVTKDEPPACNEDEPPACPEDVDSILEAVERELEQGLSLGLTADDQGPEASISGPAYLRERSQK